MQANTDALALGGRTNGRHPGFLTRLLTRAKPHLQERGLKQSPFERPGLAFMLLAPQLTVLLFFFFIPAFRALIQVHGPRSDHGPVPLNVPLLDPSIRCGDIEVAGGIRREGSGILYLAGG